MKTNQLTKLMGAAGLVTACAGGAILYLGASEPLGQLDPEEQTLFFRIHSVSGPLEQLTVDGKQPKVVEQSPKSGWKYELVIEEGEFEVSWINQGAPLRMRFNADKAWDPSNSHEPRVSVVVRERQGSKWDESLFDPLPKEGVVDTGNYRTDNLYLVVRSLDYLDGFFRDNQNVKLLQPDERPLLFSITSAVPLDDLLVDGRRPKAIPLSQRLGQDFEIIETEHGTGLRVYEIVVEEGDFVVSWTHGRSPFSMKLNAKKVRAPIEAGDTDINLSILRRPAFVSISDMFVPLPDKGIVPPGDYFTQDLIFRIRRGFPIIDLSVK